MKKIIHIDMDYFFAQVEIRDNPSLKNKPVAIGGDPKARGVLSTCNYIARKFGVRSAMPTYKALQLCPDLVLVGSHFDKYRKASEEVFSIFFEFTDKVEGISLDEAYLDVTDCPLFFNSATLIAQEIRSRIFKKTGLTASAGVSYNKLLAKIGSEINKPNGQYVIPPDLTYEQCESWSIRKINGVGKVTAKKLESLGVKTFGDIYKFNQLDLVNHFGNFGTTLFYYVRGIDNREVISSRVRKSLSVERTFMEDSRELVFLKKKLFDCFIECKQRLKKYQDKSIKSLFVKIKFSDFTQTTIEKSYLNLDYNDFESLFLKRYAESSKKIRLIGIGVRFNTNSNDEQLVLNLG